MVREGPAGRRRGRRRRGRGRRTRNDEAGGGESGRTSQVEVERDGGVGGTTAARARRSKPTSTTRDAHGRSSRGPMVAHRGEHGADVPQLAGQEPATTMPSQRSSSPSARRRPPVALDDHERGDGRRRRSGEGGGRRASLNQPPAPKATFRSTRANSNKTRLEPRGVPRSDHTWAATAGGTAMASATRAPTSTALVEVAHRRMVPLTRPGRTRRARAGPACRG